MSELYVVAPKLSSAAQELLQLNEQFKAQVGNLESVEAALAGGWEGEARDAFHNAFLKDKSQMDVFASTINAYAAAIQQAVATHNQKEAMNVQTATTRTYH